MKDYIDFEEVFFHMLQEMVADYNYVEKVVVDIVEDIVLVVVRNYFEEVDNIVLVVAD